MLQTTEDMNKCLQFKREMHWMQANGVDVQKEFGPQIEQVDDMMHKFGENNKLKYMILFNDIIKRRDNSKKFHRKGRGFLFKKMKKINENEQFDKTPPLQKSSQLQKLEDKYQSQMDRIEESA